MPAKKWVIQLGVYRNIKSSRSVANRAIALAPDSVNADIKILVMKKNNNLYSGLVL